MAEQQTDLFGNRPESGAAGGLSDQEKLAWIRLIRTESVGPVTFAELIALFGTAEAAIDALPGLARGGRGDAVQVPGLESAEREWDAALRVGASIVAVPDPAYPPLLRHIPGRPPLLFMRGDPALATRPAVAIVGSRHASAIGQQLAGDLAEAFGRNGITVVSGLARGIDSAAHRASLATGTVASIAGGIDMVYPPENGALHEAIAEQGLLVCENPPGAVPRGKDFPRRNRIISGIASGVAVIEAAKKSGSLITARLAGEQGREVFAVPGHPLDPRAAGTNALIKDGAHMLTCADDVIAELFTGLNTMQPRVPPGFANEPVRFAPADGPSVFPSEALETVLHALSYTPVHPDVLLRQTGLKPRDLTIALLELTLSGQIERHDNERVSRKPLPPPGLREDSGPPALTAPSG